MSLRGKLIVPWILTAPFLVSCSNQGFQVASHNSVDSATHVLESPLKPTTPPSAPNTVIMTESDRRTERRVTLAQLDVRFENIFVKANFSRPEKTIDVKFDLVRSTGRVAYQMTGQFREGVATLELADPDRRNEQRYFRGVARCVNQCGQVVIDLFFRSETRDFRAQFESDVHPDYRAARPTLPDSSENEAPRRGENPGDSRSSSEDRGEDGEGADIPGEPGEWVEPVLPRGFLHETAPLVDDRRLPPQDPASPSGGNQGQPAAGQEGAQATVAVPPGRETPSAGAPSNNQNLLNPSVPSNQLPSADQFSEEDEQLVERENGQRATVNAPGVTSPSAVQPAARPSGGPTQPRMEDPEGTSEATTVAPTSRVRMEDPEGTSEATTLTPEQIRMAQANQVILDRRAEIQQLAQNADEVRRIEAQRRLEEDNRRQEQRARDRALAESRIREMAQRQADLLAQREEALRRGRERQERNNSPPSRNQPRMLDPEGSPEAAQVALEQAALKEEEERLRNERQESETQAQRAAEVARLSILDAEDLELGRGLLLNLQKYEEERQRRQRWIEQEQMRRAQERRDETRLSQEREQARAREIQRQQEEINRLAREYERGYLAFREAEERRQARLQRLEELARIGALPSQIKRRLDLYSDRLRAERGSMNALAEYERQNQALPLPPAHVPPPASANRPSPSTGSPAAPSRPSGPAPAPSQPSPAPSQARPAAPSSNIPRFAGTAREQREWGFQTPQAAVVSFVERVWGEACEATNVSERFPLFPCPNLGSRHRGKAEGHYGMVWGGRNLRGNLIDGSQMQTSETYQYLTRRNFGAGITVLFLEALSRQIQRIFPSEKMQMGDISAQRGGKIDPHKSHQNGLDIDLYTFKHSRRSFDAVKNWQLIKMIFSYGIVHRVYTSRENKRELCLEAKRQGELESHQGVLQRVVFVENHQLHFHIRMQCTPHNFQTCQTDGSTLRADELCGSSHYRVN